MIVTLVDSNDGEVAIPRNVRATGNHLRNGVVGHMSGWTAADCSAVSFRFLYICTTTNKYPNVKQLS